MKKKSRGGAVTQFSDLVGKRLVRAEQLVHQYGDSDEYKEDIIEFEDDTGVVYTMFHDQECCECVQIESITGDLKDLVGDPIIVAEERMSDNDPLESQGDSGTWTFYTIRTAKASVDIRWHGTSNGYYSERVDFSVKKEAKNGI